jgi:uncharacterized membrane protein HdeD (DUF308 family)
MKKPLLLLITLITFTNVSYASFPVSENVQTEVIIKETNRISDNPQSLWSLILGIVWFPLFVALLINFEETGAIIGLLVGVLSLILGIIGVREKEKRWMSVLGIISGAIAIYMLIFFAVPCWIFNQC